MSDTLVAPPKCGCPFTERVHLGITYSIHIEPGEPVSACVYDYGDLCVDLAATDLESACREIEAWIDAAMRGEVGL
ncbi:hypothetical protein JN531_012555 [Flagellatimonas centrodinii]|uniref:hypothetical protein n=1 Tax=Flagellatimonas centrodinii TaxID=2806210 RepID=UPI001FEFBC9C|nr:hypothetical protein [Flagellatimonas centrodinii]ULQ45930.1 hypothetical protein JN531_012555 [Flagellatimonas centrodinii]